MLNLVNLELRSKTTGVSVGEPKTICQHFFLCGNFNIKIKTWILKSAVISLRQSWGGGMLEVAWRRWKQWVPDLYILQVSIIIILVNYNLMFCLNICWWIIDCNWFWNIHIYNINNNLFKFQCSLQFTKGVGKTSFGLEYDILSVDRGEFPKLRSWYSVIS